MQSSLFHIFVSLFEVTSLDFWFSNYATYATIKSNLPCFFVIPIFNHQVISFDDSIGEADMASETFKSVKEIIETVSTTGKHLLSFTSLSSVMLSSYSILPLNW